MTQRFIGCVVLRMSGVFVASGAAVPGYVAPAYAAPAAYHHLHMNAPTAAEGVRWYITHMECKAFPGRADIADCGPATLVFFGRAPTGPSAGTGVNHIGFSFANLDAKVKSLEAAGVKVTGQVRDIPNLFKIAFLEDPWGTRIELVEHEGYSGLHHVHLSSTEPDKTLTWYQHVFGGERTKMKGMLDAVLYGKIWLLAAASKDALVPAEGRAVDHLGFSLDSMDAAVADMKQKGVTFTREPFALTSSTALASRIAFVSGPDGVSIEVMELIKR